MKILILVLTYNEHPYDELLKAQKETWDSIEEPDISTIYYTGGLNQYGATWIPRQQANKSILLETSGSDKYYYMASKFKVALEFAKDLDYDFIFRTNSSSYVNKQRLKDFVETLPKEKLYAGWTFVDSEDFGGLCVSGAGIFLSRDTAEILREHIDPNFEQEEDVYCGRILRKHGIVAIDDKSRVDVSIVNYETPTGAYHYRFKTNDRLKDANNMKELHKRII